MQIVLEFNKINDSVTEVKSDGILDAVLSYSAKNYCEPGPSASHPEGMGFIPTLSHTKDFKGKPTTVVRDAPLKHCKG